MAAKNIDPAPVLTPGGADALSARLPVAARLAYEIPKPKDWQALQRNCVILFRRELEDPNATEFGRLGQNQKGIDVLGKRRGDANHLVGVQCRLIAEALTEATILKDCRATLGIQGGLKEIIFATTAPDDAPATEAGVAVQRRLQGEGYDLSVSVYGWGQLQTLIALHPEAYAAFFPAAVAASAPISAALSSSDKEDIARLTAQMVTQVMLTKDTALAAADGGHALSAEDPVLHAKIDALRDMFQEHRLAKGARSGLQKLAASDLSARPGARFRIATIIGSIEMELGEEEKAAKLYEEAYAIRPEDQNAVANLALARTMQGRNEEAMALAERALGMQPRAEAAIGYLLQAAARGTWVGDVETLIPPELAGSEPADIGLAYFLRRRSLPGWPERTLEISANHPESEPLKHMAAVAVLEIALRNNDFIVGGQSSVTLAQVSKAADEMTALATENLDAGFADTSDLIAQVNNAAVLLRFARREVESENLIRKALPNTGNSVVLRRVLAMALLAQERGKEAAAILAEAPRDAENDLVAIEIRSADDPAAALALAEDINTAELDSRLKWLQLSIIGELALKLGDYSRVHQAVARLREEDLGFPFADVLEVRALKKQGSDGALLKDKLTKLAARLPDDATAVWRFEVAKALEDVDLPTEASRVLEGKVDLKRNGVAAILLLRNLASARRDVAFEEAVASASPELLNDPEIRWVRIIHAWNTGDMPKTLGLIEESLAIDPDYARIRLLKVEALARLNRFQDVVAELRKPVENLVWKRTKDRFRVAALLSHFGFEDRAAALAYRLFMEHRDVSRAWMTLTMIVLEGGRKPGEDAWSPTKVAKDTAVVIMREGGAEQLVVVEPDASLRKLDDQSLEPDHALVKAIIGLGVGDKFQRPDGHEGTVKSIRHKYVARAHYAMEHHETRFPEIFGFRSVPVNFEAPDGLDAIKEILRNKQEWVELERERYEKGAIPFAIFAQRVGADPIDAAAALATAGGKLKVARGWDTEREGALREIIANQRKGCSIDMLTFWNAWRLGAADTVSKVCGKIHLPRSVFDRLLARREQLKEFLADGRKTMFFREGHIAAHEVAPKEIASYIDDLDKAFAWIEANGTVMPVVAGLAVPDHFRDLIRSGKGDALDALLVAREAGLLFVSDDMPSREIAMSIFRKSGAWLHEIFSVAASKRHCKFEDYTRWTAHLIAAGQSYIGASGATLHHALRLDAEEDKGAPGYFFRTIAQSAGGADAEIVSHLNSFIQFIDHAWEDPSLYEYRKPATSLLLERLLRTRSADWQALLDNITRETRVGTDFQEFVQAWARGHFLLLR